MATLNLSSNGPSITKSYQSVVNSSAPPSGSSTYGKWAIFTVSTPLTSAFQQDAANKESVLKVQDTGEGELMDLIDDFSEGKIQFAFVKVTDPNTGLPKNVLIAWCGEGVPERTKGYFTSHLSAVSKFLHGYHVQITARSEGDLTAEGIVRRVGDASGAKYSSGAEGPTPTTAPKPPVSSKPVFNPLRTTGTTASPTTTFPVVTKGKNDDGWGPDAPPITRTNLEKVQPAYRPTKVNIQQLRSENQSGTNFNPDSPSEAREDVVKGGYQPVGKVDIAEIRRQARQAGGLKDDRPEPVKGAYEPVGKVDIAAIRSRALKAEDLPAARRGTSPTASSELEMSRNATSPDHSTAPPHSGRLTSLPKPKVFNKLGGSTTTFPGTKPPLPNENLSTSTSAQVGSASRTFADEGGKTPAQLWAERKARERGQDPISAVSQPANTGSSIQTQNSGTGEWKSSYTGKTWAPVQTTHTGKSVGSNRSVPDHDVNDGPLAEARGPSQNVDTIGKQSIQESLNEAHTTGLGETSGSIHSISSSDLPQPPTDHEATHESEIYSTYPTEPQPARSPTPPSPPARDESPIRVAMPVGNGAEGAHEERNLPPVAPIRGAPADKDSEDPRGSSPVRPETTSDEKFQDNGITAIVQYEYERAEANEIDLKEGELVTEIDMVDKDWWLGLNGRGERGLFPSNYVELVEDNQQEYVAPDTHDHGSLASELDSESRPHTSPANKLTARALYDYEAAEDNELSFPEGAEIMNIEFPDDDWWFGEYLNRKGLFPANYVQLEK